ncbi:MAG TPA: hypothetical protein VF092_13065 [Longimicrobium sp.]
MPDQTADAPASGQLPIPDLHVAPPPASTLGQTPHEPAVRPWELELLISGALVFSMLQIPGQLDAWLHGIEPRMDGARFQMVFLAWFYVKLAVYALAVGFSVHLAVRGYWVGAIGLEAVFPNGIVWERARGGPIVREMQRQRTPRMQTVIDRADRLASMVFGGAFALALLLVYALMIGGSAMLLGFAVAGAFGASDRGPLLMEAVMALYVIPIMVVTLLDKRLGDRLDPGSRLARVIRGVGRAYTRMQEVVPFTPLMMTLLTNLRGRRGLRVVTVLLVVGGVGIAAKKVVDETGAVHTDGYDFLPDAPGALGVARGYYDDRRGDGTDFAELPFIQSDMVRDPYVRLFVPYRPRRHNQLVRERCPRVRAAVPAGGVFGAERPEGDRAGQAVLACLASLQPATLDGKPIASAWRFAADPKTGVRGIVAYLPVAALAKGEHVITVAKLPPRDPEEAKKPNPPFAIPFWL